MINYDKSKIRENVTLDNVFELLFEWGGEPEYTNFGLITTTICHNKPGVGSRKLYYYSNSKLFQCYSGGCGFFDIFELYIKVQEIQFDRVCDLNEAVRYISNRLGIFEYLDTKAFQVKRTEDEIKIDRYSSIRNKAETFVPFQPIELKEYDDTILKHLNYRLSLKPWLKEGITQEVLDFAKIGYYLADDQITIPHYDRNGRFVGLRGRTMCEENAEAYGKYRPVRAGGIQYNHPLGANLYGLNWAKDNIKISKKAIVFESEKSVLLYMSYFGIENSIAVACCGSHLSQTQMELLREAGANEVIIAFDRQFKILRDDEFNKLQKTINTTIKTYKPYLTITAIKDINYLTNYKSAPIDHGKEIFEKLFLSRCSSF